MRPKAIIENLNLRRPIYRKTASYGHFGRNDEDFTLGKNRQGRDFKKRSSDLILIFSSGKIFKVSDI